MHLIRSLMLTTLLTSGVTIQGTSNIKWFKMGGIGFHHHGTAKAISLDSATAKKYFTAKYPFLSASFQKEILPQLLKKASKNPLKQARLLPPGDPAPFAEVSKFNQQEVYIKILNPLGGWRWHHYFHTLAIYKLKRDQTINTIFMLDDLSKKFGFTYRGIKHGMELSDKAVVQLGKPDYSYPSQNPSLKRLYYRKHHLHIVIHHNRVYYIEKGIPGWVKQMKNEIKNKTEQVCQAELKSYTDRYFWSEHNESGHSSFTAPAATFKIIEPKKYQNREVRIILDQTKKGISIKRNHRYRIVFPVDFLKSKSNTINVEHLTIEIIDHK